MRMIIIIFAVFSFFFLSCQEDEDQIFKDYFTEGTMRIDYSHTGDAKSESIKVDKLYQYTRWAGSMVNLIDKLNYGVYHYKIYDKASGELIYSKGFDSYFKEYQTSTPAMEGQQKQFQESAIIPFPKAEIIFTIEKVYNTGGFEEIFRTNINPILAEKAPMDPEVKVYNSLITGNPHVRADIAIIGEGYTKGEDRKFQDDLERFTNVFFKAEPCKTYKNSFNIYGVLKYSRDSGIDEPRAAIDKNTAVNATFNSLGSERYVLTEDNKSLRDIAGHVPYDALYIMVNHSRYGGGGIYNLYCVFTSDNIDSEYLMVHEFGHSFFGLADEYYTSSTAYNDFYSADYEPIEPNITALPDRENIKWKHLLSKGILIPTPWEKDKFDSMDLKWQAERRQLNDHIAELQRKKASQKIIQKAKDEYDQKSTAHNKEVQEYLSKSKYAGKVGVFEGAGYISKGMYRSSVNCIMFTRTDFFCPVCQEAMIKVIETYSK
jgi:IgA Peptidase M64/Peptidase M64 N-terminus